MTVIGWERSLPEYFGLIALKPTLSSTALQPIVCRFSLRLRWLCSFELERIGVPVTRVTSEVSGYEITIYELLRAAGIDE